MTRIRRLTFGSQLAGIAVIGVGLRAAYVFTIGRHPAVTPLGDWHWFDWEANLIADGKGFADPYQALFYGHAVPSAGHPPLYPLLLSVVSVLGHRSQLAHRLVGLPLAALTICLVGLLGRRVGGPRVGLVAAGLYCFYPSMIAADGALFSEALYGPLIAAMLLAAYRVLDHPGPWPAAGLGGLIGLAALTRSEALLLLPLLGWAVAWRARNQRGTTAAIATVTCLVVIAPWTVRNFVAFDRFVLISTNDATVVAGANCRPSYYGQNLGGWSFECLSPRRTTNEAAQASIWLREGRQYAEHHLGRLPAVALVRFLRVWDLYQPIRQAGFAEGRDRNVQKVGTLVYFLFLLVAVAGVVALRRRQQPLIVLLAPAVVTCVTAVTGYGLPRLRHPFEISLMVLAAIGFLSLCKSLGHRREMRLARA